MNRPRFFAAVIGAAAMFAATMFAGLAVAGPREDAFAAYESGDIATALRLWGPRAAQGEPKAQYGLGYLYLTGQGVRQNDREAAKWLRLAAVQGNMWAQKELGSMYAKGSGVARDYAQAMTWRRRAAMQGHAGAQVLLGYMYFLGMNTEPDYVRAYMWFEIASAKSQDGAEKRDGLATLMSAPQINTARKLAAQWIGEHRRD